MATDPKALRRTMRRLIFLGGGLLLLGIIFSAIEHQFNSRSGALNINIKPVDGQRFLHEKDIKKAIKNNFYANVDKNQPLKKILKNEPIGRINVRAIEQLLDDHPFVLDADVYVDAKNDININIKQRTPVLRLIDKSGEHHYVDKTGVRMPRSIYGTARVPVASGYIVDTTKGNYNVVDSLLKMINYVRQDTFLIAQVEQIYVDKFQEFTLIPKVGNHKIIFGKLEDMEGKFRRLKIFYREALPYQGWRRYRQINLKYKHQVVGVK